MGRSWQALKTRLKPKKSLPSSSSGATSAQLAICDKITVLSEKQWQQAQSQLAPAISAFEKCEKDGLRYLQAIGPDNKLDSSYPVLKLGSVTCL